MNKKLSFFGQFGLGVTSYGKAISFVMQNGLWIYFIYPVIVALLLFFGLFSFISDLSDGIENYILGFIDSDAAESSWLSFLTGFLHFFLAIGLKILFFFLFYTFNKYILLILMSPVMAILSEKAEEIITGKTYAFNVTRFCFDILRGIGIALRNMFIEFGIMFLCLIIIWIPVIGWIVPIFLFILSYYFYGFSMIDYMSERRKLNISQSVKYIRANKGLAIGNGFIFSLLFAIPLAGGMLAAIIAPVAACIAVLESEK